MLRLNLIMTAAWLMCAMPAHAADAVSDANAWILLHNDHGVSVWQRPLPGTSLAQFRARALVSASAIAITAVIFDTEHTREWNDNCKENYTLVMKGPGHSVTYNRSGSPAFFISERDLVVEYEISLHSATKIAHIDFRNLDLPQVPAQPGVVRMPRVEGYYEVREVDADTSEVTYDITADPGGAVPLWLVNWVSRSLIGKVMERLGVQAHQPMYAKLIGHLQQSLDWRGFSIPPPAPLPAQVPTPVL